MVCYLNYKIHGATIKIKDTVFVTCFPFMKKFASAYVIGLRTSYLLTYLLTYSMEQGPS